MRIGRDHIASTVYTLLFTYAGAALPTLLLIVLADRPTGFILSSYRPKAPLFVFSKERSLINQLSLSWGVRAFYYAEEENLDTIIFDQVNILKERGFVKAADVVVSTGSTPTKLHLPTNTIKITIVE